MATALAMTAVPAGAAGNDAKPFQVAKPKALGAFDAGKLTGIDREAKGRIPVFVQFSGQGAASVAAQGASRVLDRRAQVENQSADAVATARRADAKAKKLYTVSNAVPGVAMEVSAKGAAALADRPDVVRVWRMYPKTIENSNAVSFVKAMRAWKFNGGLGNGVRVAVIDTGLDYTHADFGGAGTTEAYNNEDPTSRTWWQDLSKKGKAKIAGGFDFAGDDYNADDTSPSYQPIASPDPNPLDCHSHGTHVAGTALGYGVNAKGKTFSGKYQKLTADKLMNMKVGPGVAPKAKVYAYKIFGCGGSTNLTIQALDRSLDPNVDGRFNDRVDVINMSIGSPYGPVDDPENLFINTLSKYGVLSVASNGNEGDVTDIGGSPGSAVSALTVASSVDSYQLLDGLKVNAPTEGMKAGQFSVEYDWANNGPTGQPVTGDVVKLSDANSDGCDPLSAADAAAVDGKVAWLTWDSNDITRRCGSVGRSANVANAGAIGAVFTGDVSPFAAGISGSQVIPVFQLTKNATAELQPAVDAGTLNVTFDGQYMGVIQDLDNSIADLLSGFSSRGNHASIGNAVKPDVAAPGDSIASAAVGTGNGAMAMSGTSMAAPMTAGTAALVRGKHPKWNVLKVKAAVVNTATHDVWTGNNRSGDKYAPARVGTGRINALNAFRTKYLAYVKKNRAVSATFGVVPAPITGGTVTKTRKVVVQNTARKAKRFSVSYQAVNPGTGVTYSVSPKSFVVKGKKSKKVTVTMTVDPTALTRTIDPTMEATQVGLPRQFVSDSSGRLLVKPKGKKALRVAVYGAAKPVSETTASVNGSSIALTGTGVLQGDGSEKYESLISVMTLGATSDVLPECDSSVRLADGSCTANTTETGGDIKAIGAGADSEWVWFGMSTHGDWANIGNIVIPYVDYDVDGDGVYDYETYVTNYPGTDVLLAVTVNLKTGEQDLNLVNFWSADYEDTNVFDSNVIVLPAWKGFVNTPGDITYTAGTYYAYTGGDIDTLEADGTFNADQPAFSVAGPLFSDQGDTNIPFTNTGAATKALVFHLYGAKGARDEILDIPAAN